MLGFTHCGARPFVRLGVAERMTRRRKRLADDIKHRPLNCFLTALR